MKKSIIVTLFSFLYSTLSLAASQIHFATEASYPPFEFKNEQNQIVGFDIDIANALCDTLKAKCTFSSQSFDSLIPSLRTRRIDAAIAGIDVTPERAAQVSFTNIYYHNSAIFITANAQLNSIEALKGGKVGIQNGTTHQKYLIEQHPEINVMSYDSYNNAILDLKNGRIDAVFIDNAVGQEWLNTVPTLKQIQPSITDVNYFGHGLAIALRKNNTELQKTLNKALSTIKENGKYNEIYQRWFKE